MEILKNEISEVVIGLIFTSIVSLFTFCAYNLKTSYDELFTHYEETNEKLINETIAAQTYLNWQPKLKEIDDRQAKRFGLLKYLSPEFFKKNPIIPDSIPDYIFQKSSEFRRQIREDLAAVSILDDLSNEFDYIGANKMKLDIEELLKSELDIWKKLTTYIEVASNDKERGTNGQKAFNDYDFSMMNHYERLNIRTERLGKALQDSLKIDAKKNATTTEYENKLKKIKSKLKWLFIGSLISGLILLLIIIAVASNFWKSRKKNLQQEVKNPNCLPKTK